ncbi:hypothetical protein FN846DRAFT_775017 [Sphaerosporella brunnea]|uniref:Sacsin/Nov domain-containing protein n=1 Tax=Sphaerosporella brunnea TaxID=1250544 RepID=A0A5J5F2W0_9PEZI|nr:hypothetical protein FN846DRAFT_775017 [Sphaerosporella brunnea]
MVIKPTRNNAQHQPLTTVLRNIVREYPAGGGVLRELCQNADDSGATAIEFILDPAYHPTEPLLHPGGGLAEFQGPALLAYNNRTFSERDFRSLSKIGDSEKLHDLNSTGKFGRGFNSVYNWTDNPSIISGSALLILDPHETWSRDVGEPGGPLWDFVENHQEPEMANQLAPFRCLINDFSRPYEGTIIRLPLRTAEQAARSEIVRDLERKSTGFEDIKEVFESFSTEMVEYLLFLRHISSIRLKIGNEVFAEAVARKFSLEGDITDSFTIDDAYRRVLVQGLEETRVHQFVMAITSQKDGETSTARYAVTHQMRHSHPDGELHEWSRSYKLFPWAAIACPISEGLLQNFSGKLFSTLPLPIRSQHPAHIHAMFSITPDRASIHRDEDSTVSERTETKRGSRWNRWIFEDLVVSAWTANLQFISDLTDRNDCPFAGWNVWPLGGKEQGSLGVGILEGVFERIVTGELRLLPTIGKSLARPSHSLFATRLATSLEEALREATVVVVFPPNDRREQLCQISRRYSLRSMAPTSIREVLSALEPFPKPMSNSSRSALLDYILSDNDYEEIGDCCARLLPMLDGTFEAFQHRSGCIEVRFARSQEELELFDQCNSWVIDNTKLSSDSLDHFKYQMALLERFTRVSRWDLEGAAFYCGSWVFPEEKKRCKGHFVNTIVRPELLEWVNRFWKWAVALDRKGAMLAFENLWLLPLTGNRLLKLPPTTITLDVSGSGQVAQLFRKILAYSSTVASDYYIYTTNETMSRTNTEFFREAKFIYDCEKLENLVLWLDSCPELLNFASHEQRTQLVDLMGILAVKHIAQETKTRLGKLLKGLPLFHPAFNREEKRPWISLNGLANYVAISTKDGLPAFQHAGAIETIFVDKDCRGALSLLNAFSLCKTPSKAELLQQYVLPSLEKSTGKTKAALSQYILHWQNLMELSHDRSAIERLASMKFVPVRGSESMLKSPPELVDPSTVVEGLYFLDEHPFPRADFLQNFRGGLTTLGMITRITNAVVLERLKKYSRCPDQFDGISHRLQLMLNERPIPPLLGSEYRELKWIPASMDGKEGLFSASECRDHSRKNLVKYVMPLTKLEIGPRWATELGWFKPPSLHIVLEQLRMAILNMDNSVIVSLLDAGWLKDESVQSVLEQMAWIPGISGGYYHRSDIFFHNAEFHPYLDVLSPLVGDFFPEGRATSLCFTLEKEPSLRKLAEVQGKLASRKGLSKKNLAVYVSLLNSAAERFKDADFSTWKFPDADGVMHDCCEMTVGAPPRDGGQDAITKALHFLHPSIPQTTIDLLQFPTVQDRFLEKRVGPEFIQDFEQGQELTAIISDSLQRYPIQDTFNEYLANAEDSGGAEKITWVVDATTKYPKVNLITNKLEECTGEALLCHNDGCFSQKDLDSLTDIGNSSKRDEVSKIGRFGRGSLTMYHWTCTPSFITGEHFVIIDPEQKRLPNNPTTRKPRKGMLLSIRDVRQLCGFSCRPF